MNYFVKLLLKMRSVFLAVASARAAAAIALFVAASAFSAAASASAAAASAFCAAASSFAAISSKRLLAASARAAAALDSCADCIACFKRALSFWLRPQPLNVKRLIKPATPIAIPEIYFLRIPSLEINIFLSPLSLLVYLRYYLPISQFISKKLFLKRSLVNFFFLTRPIKNKNKIFLGSIIVALLIFMFSVPSRASRRPFIVIDKATQTLTVFKNGRKVESFPVSLGLDSYSDKRKRGDCATPEGCFYITYKKPDSKYYLFMGLSYPNRVDAWWAYRRKLITVFQMMKIWRAIKLKSSPPTTTALGGAIGIHGGGVFKKGVRDWTEGCIALNNIAMSKLYNNSYIGEKVVILNSKKDFFSMMLPFALPYDPITSYDSCLTLNTNLGKIVLLLRQEPDYSRFLELFWIKDKMHTIIIKDKNADGILGFEDSIRGIKEGTKTLEKQKLYNELLRACKNALIRGKVNPGCSNLFR